MLFASCSAEIFAHALYDSEDVPLYTHVFTPVGVLNSPVGFFNGSQSRLDLRVTMQSVNKYGASRFPKCCRRQGLFLRALSELGSKEPQSITVHFGSPQFETASTEDGFSKLESGQPSACGHPQFCRNATGLIPILRIEEPYSLTNAPENTLSGKPFPL